MKKRIDIVGTLEYPIINGCAAFIRETNGSFRRTSSVKHFVVMPSGLICIETKNTHYYLHPPTVKDGKKVDMV